MLESYVQEVGSTLVAMEALSYAIESTESFVSFRLDSARNSLLKIEVLATVGGCVLALGSMVSGFFGMNVPSSLYDEQHKDWVFIAVVSGTVGPLLLLGAVLLYILYSPSGGCDLLGRHLGTRRSHESQAGHVTTPRPRGKRRLRGMLAMRRPTARGTNSRVPAMPAEPQTEPERGSRVRAG